jgi:hypothetical protein
MYLIISEWDENNHPTSVNQKATLQEAQSIVDRVGGFFVETPHAYKLSKYITVDPVNQIIDFDLSKETADKNREKVMRDIQKLESSVTPRRIREMTTDSGKQWVNNVEELIAIERGKL